MSEVDGKKQDQVVHDITVPIHAGMHVYDGNPGVRLDLHSSIAAGAGANVSRLELGVHTGTHVDAPLHFIEGGAGTESLDLETLIGPASVVDATAVTRQPGCGCLLRLEGSDGASARAILRPAPDG